MSRKKDPFATIKCEVCRQEKQVLRRYSRNRFCSKRCALVNTRAHKRNNRQSPKPRVPSIPRRHRVKARGFVLVHSSDGMNYRTARLILGTHAAATYTDIKRAFRAKAKELHPDRNRSRTATERFANLTRAQQFLMRYRSPYQRDRYRARSFGNRGGYVRWALVPLSANKSN